MSEPVSDIIELVNCACINYSFNITNVKISICCIYDIIPDLSTRDDILSHTVRSMTIIHSNDFSYTLFKLPTKTIHVTGIKCLCKINEAVSNLSSFTNITQNMISFIKIGTISISFDIPRGLKSKVVNMNRNYFSPFDMRIPFRFPGIIFKKPDSSISCTIFNSGKGIACGFKRMGQIYDFMNLFQTRISTVVKLNMHEA